MIQPTLPPPSVERREREKRNATPEDNRALRAATGARCAWAPSRRQWPALGPGGHAPTTGVARSLPVRLRVSTGAPTEAHRRWLGPQQAYGRNICLPRRASGIRVPSGGQALFAAGTGPNVSAAFVLKRQPLESPVGSKKRPSRLPPFAQLAPGICTAIARPAPASFSRQPCPCTRKLAQKKG